MVETNAVAAKVKTAAAVKVKAEAVTAAKLRTTAKLKTAEAEMEGKRSKKEGERQQEQYGLIMICTWFFQWFYDRAVFKSDTKVLVPRHQNSC